jgi:hypothetical protein
VPKTYNGKKTAPSTTVAGKRGYLYAESKNQIHVSHLVQLSTQSGLRTFISDLKP